jgi:hypothetical protein
VELPAEWHVEQIEVSMYDAKSFASIRSQWAVILLVFVSVLQPAIGIAQAKDRTTKANADEDQAKQEALSALKLLHENQISKLYREKISDLQKTTGLTSEAKAIAAYGPTAQTTPGTPQERTLLFAQRTEKLPVLFQDLKADFYSFVFLAKYPAGTFQEEVYMVKEKSDWKVAAIGVRSTL